MVRASQMSWCREDGSRDAVGSWRNRDGEVRWT